MNAKRHHFVPQFLLRGFSSDQSKRRISIYDIEKCRVIHNTSIKDQAQRQKLYKTQDIESIFSTIDGWAASSIQRMLRTYQPPIKHSHEHGRLLIYLLTQAKRTPAAAARYLNDMSQTLTQYTRLMKPEADGNGTIIVDHPSAEVWLAARIMHMYPLGTDLRIKMLCSPCQNIYVSDNPAVFLNLMSHRHVSLNPGNGIASSGLVALLPVNTSHCLIFYDEQAYTVGSKKHSKFVVNISAAQAEELNDIQYASAYRFVYFNGSASQQGRILNSAKNVDKSALYAQSHLFKHPEIYREGGRQYQYMEARAGRIMPNAKMSFVKLNPNYKLPVYENPQYTGVRNIQIVLFHNWLSAQAEPDSTYADTTKYAEWLNNKINEYCLLYPKSIRRRSQ